MKKTFFDLKNDLSDLYDQNEFNNKDKPFKYNLISKIIELCNSVIELAEYGG